MTFVTNLVLVLAVSWATLTLAVTDHPNLLVNPVMADGDSNRCPDGWVCWGDNAEVIYTVENGEGQLAMKPDVYVWQDTFCDPKLSFFGNVQAKAASWRSTATIKVEFYKQGTVSQGKGNQITVSEKIGMSHKSLDVDTTRWTTIEADVVVPQGTQACRYVLYAWGGTVLFKNPEFYFTLLPNGGFFNCNQGYLDAWEIGGSGVASCMNDGSQSVAYLSGRDRKFIMQTVNAVELRTYRVETSAKSANISNTASTAAIVSVRFYNRRGDGSLFPLSETSGQIDLNTASTWVTKTLQVTAPVDADAMSVTLEANSGDVYFDDVLVSENIALNPTFASGLTYPDHWIPWSEDGTVNSFWTTEGCYDDRRCLRIDHGGVVWQTFPLLKQGIYYLSIMARSSSQFGSGTLYLEGKQNGAKVQSYPLKFFVYGGFDKFDIIYNVTYSGMDCCNGMGLAIASNMGTIVVDEVEIFALKTR